MAFWIGRGPPPSPRGIVSSCILPPPQLSGYARAMHAFRTVVNKRVSLQRQYRIHNQKLQHTTLEYLPQLSIPEMYSGFRSFFEQAFERVVRHEFHRKYVFAGQWCTLCRQDTGLDCKCPIGIILRVPETSRYIFSLPNNMSCPGQSLYR